jgi:hypothetical protein
MVMFYNIKDFIEENDIHINYFCKLGFNNHTHNDNTEYHSQLQEFNPSKNIVFYDLNLLYYNKDIHTLSTWIGNPELEFNVFNSKHLCFNEFLANFFTKLLELMNIPIRIEKFQFIDTGLIDRYNVLDDSYKNIDILIINSKGLSGQQNNSEEVWPGHIKYLANKYKIVTTRKVDGVLSTTDCNFSLKTISAISTKAKVIIAINTGVVPALYNKYTLDNVRKAYIFDENTHINVNYSYDRFENSSDITSLTYDVLDKYIIS